MSEPEKGKLVAFDLETTGLKADEHRIVEIGAIRFEMSGVVLGTFQSLINPKCPVPPTAMKIHGLSDDELRGAPSCAEVLQRFLQWLGPPDSVLLMAHNAQFDAGFMAHELGRAGLDEPGYQVADTLSLARRYLPKSPSHKLASLALALGLDGDAVHRALADSRRVMQLWLHLAKLHAKTQPDSLTESCVRFRLSHAMARSADDLPIGSDWLTTAIVNRQKVRLIYEGGSKGDQPRTITPLRWSRRAGSVYIAALCHLDGIEKEFRIERIRSAMLLDPDSLPEPE